MASRRSASATLATTPPPAKRASRKRTPKTPAPVTPITPITGDQAPLMTASEVINQWIPLAMIVDHPRNYKRHPADQIAKLKASLIRFGQVRSAVVQAGLAGQCMMVAGHGVKSAAAELGWTHLKCDTIPAHWTQEQVDAYLVADNLLGEGGIEDEVLLAELLQEQRNLGNDLAALGSSDEALDALLERLANDVLNDPNNPFADPDSDAEDDLDDDADGEPPRRSDGSLLSLVNITLAEPTHTPQRGEVWCVGPHTLVCADVISGWAQWTPYLEGEDVLFAPYAGPFVPLSLRAEAKTLVMVQPDLYVAGHLLDRYAEVNGEMSVRCVRGTTSEDE